MNVGFLFSRFILVIILFILGLIFLYFLSKGHENKVIDQKVSFFYLIFFHLVGVAYVLWIIGKFIYEAFL